MNVRPYIPGQKSFKKRTIRPGAFLNKGALLVIVFFVIIGILSYVFWGSDWFRVTNISIQPAGEKFSLVARERLQSWIEERKWIFSRGANIFLVGEDQIVDFFNKNFPELEVSDIERSGLHELTMNVRRKIPFAHYCARGNSCLLVDESGDSYAFACGSAGPALLYIEDSSSSTSSDTLVLRKGVLSREQIQNYREIRDSLRALNLEIDTFEIPAAAFLLHVRLASGCRLIFNITSNLQDQLNIFAQILGDTLKEIPLSTLEYIDLSIQGKVYYRLSGSSEVSGREI